MASSIAPCRKACIAVLMLAVCGVGGCGPKKNQAVSPSSVSGFVRLDDDLVKYGSVAFVDENGQQSKSIIKADGSYNIHNPPIGKVKIVVRTGAPPVPMGAPEGPPIKATKIERIDIPEHYSDPAKTDLTYTVVPGDQQWDINLKSKPESKKS